MKKSFFMHKGNIETANKAQKLVDALIDGSLQHKDLIDYEIFSALYLQPNNILLREMRNVFDTKLKKLCSSLNSNSNLPQQTKELLLSKYLELLPISNIKPNRIYEIPTYDEEKKTWHLVKYRASPIELTPTSGLERLVLADNDRLFAYGLIPLDKLNIKPCYHLIFPNAKYPAQQGFFSQFYLNFQTTETVYTACQKQISAWINENIKIAKLPVNIHADGYSGRIACMTARDQNITQHIGCVYIQNDYGINIISANKNQQSPKIYIQNSKNHYNSKQNSDNLRRVENLNNLYFHGFWYTLTTNIILRNLVNSLFVYPLHFLFLPLIRFILNHKMQLALTLSLILVFVMLPGLTMTEFGITTTAFIVSYYTYKLIEPLKTILGYNEKTDAICHQQDMQDIQEKIDVLQIQQEIMWQKINKTYENSMGL